MPARGGQPCPPGIPPIELSDAETARIERLARDWKAGLITRARLAFRLRWSALASPPPGPRPLAPLQHPPPGAHHLTHDGRKEVTRCNRQHGNQMSRLASTRPQIGKQQL